jgi:uncharacterized protein (TIGR02466 family)
MNYTIENWFPKPIYYADDVCLDFLDQFEQEIKKIVSTTGAKKSQYLGVQSTHMTDSELQLNPVFHPLTDAIKNHVFEFGTALGYSPTTAFKFYIGNMWANVSGQHEYNFPHTHPGAVISGAFYIKTVPENVIAFYDKYDTIQLPENHTAYDNKPIEYRCVPGRLLLFKSDFVHGNPAQQSEGEKIVISFNMLAGS